MDRKTDRASRREVLGCRQALGNRISVEAQKRIERFLADPTADNWDDICGIVIPGRESAPTVWETVIQVDPTFPKDGRSTGLSGRVVKEWERVPAPEQVLQALRKAAGQERLAPPAV